MKEFRKQYQNEPVDFHLWSQDKIAEFWWRAALEWAKSRSIKRLISVNEIEWELGGE